ncbi:MAG: hypothetical protein Aurels2KO_55600 [Aureliella sp.]
MVSLEAQEPANTESAGLWHLRLGWLNGLDEIEIEEALFFILKICEVTVNV